MFKLLWPPHEGIISIYMCIYIYNKKKHVGKAKQHKNKNKDFQTTLAEVRPSAD